jgi:hypothetical protein
MDKVFMLIILLIVGFWGFLKYSEDSGNWIATGNNGVIGEYSSYVDCVEGVKSTGLN